MAEQEKLEKIREGIQVWNTWKKQHLRVSINLSSADLSLRDLHGIDLSGADLEGAKLRSAKLSGANLSGANLNDTDLDEADQHLALIERGATIGDAKLWYDRPKKQFYLLVPLTIDIPDPTPAQLSEVVGIDVGIRYLAVTSTSTGKASFHPGKRTRHQANHYARLRKRLQKTRTIDRYSRAYKAQEAQTQEARQRLRAGL